MRNSKSFILFVMVLTLVVQAAHNIAIGQIDFTEHTVSADFNGAHHVFAIDVDSDGDNDVLSAGYDGNRISWFENTDNQVFIERNISANFGGAIGVYAIDLDQDDDIDVLGSSLVADDITWWENDGDEDFTEHTIAGEFDGNRSIFAIDVDSDGDIDVLGAATGGDEVTWWENNGQQEFEEHTIDDFFDGAINIFAVDVDGDNDVDVLSAGFTAAEITWWENDGEEDFTEHTIAEDYAQAIGLYATDVDGDDDIDVLGTSQSGNEVTWWENDGEQPPEFDEHVISDEFTGAYAVYATDMDLDGDMDVLGAAYGDDAITWWENDGAQPPDFTEHTITANFDGARSVYAIDIDGDGDMDVLGAARNPDDVLWWESDLDPVPDATLEGTVTDGENGDAVEDAIVRAGAVRDTTDANGNYFIDDVLSGERTVIVTHPDYSRHIEEIEIEEGENTLDMELFPLSTVSGTVTDIDTGDPIEDAEIRFGNDEIHTDENGDWEAPPQEQGERFVVISADHYYVFSEQVEVEPGENFFEFELIPLATISGTITDSETEAAVEDAEIVFGDFLYTATSDENGDYSIEDVEAGEYAVTITAEGYFEFTDDIEVEERENEIDFSIDILSGDLTGVVSDEITEELLFEVTVTVIDPETGEIYREALTDEDGEYTAEALHEGIRYLVFAELEGYARSDTEEVLIRSDRDNEQDFELTPIFERGIAQLQTEQDLETWVSTTGIVTQGTNTTDTEHTDIYIQDDTGWGIQVWDDDPWDPENNINRGDAVNVTGYLVEVDEITRITSFELEVTGNDNPLPEPLIESTGDMSQLNQREGTWGQIAGQINRDPPEEGDYSLIVDDGSGQCEVRIIENSRIDLSEFSADDWGTFAGVIGLSRQGLRIIPNMLEDVDWIPIEPPYNLEYQAEVLEINDVYYALIFLEWSHDHLDEWNSFNIYRDGERIGNTTENSWVDSIEIDIDSLYQWEFGVTAVYNEVETEPVLIYVFNRGAVGDQLYSGIPTEWALEAVYPNPFNPELSIIIGLPFKSELDVRIYNLLGKKVVEIANGSYSPGYKHFTFDASELSSGIYFIHTSVPGKMNEVRKVVLMR
ncbi:MAG: carboxypeptidase regulatory-like domain-containing protein [Candidatus Electryonea clarkiae]|nr:carboxypeptidase regulatory-like domain-containing protein [Candidatus Electryonea clarkiae]MDP8287802.1 carboxypeptidase regulatory-like domain-containing protein [Candidatus Electryonea clarkiae]